ncbi:unnamed protein product [Schistocephalus solidus]|uniref:C2H2-type domain-containing protein n=1 Tax=Schistocephalus solidus TaxID=70667 RepID=A0A183ST08_SCHSO|nr:unnamed protein product [Schistocephalus solidus]
MLSTPIRARISLVGHLRTQCNNNPITSNSATPASDPTTTINPTTDNNFLDAPLPMITDTIFPPPPSAPIKATNTTCPTPTTLVSISDFVSPATSNTTTTPGTSDGESVITCPQCDRTFTSSIGLIGHLRIHRTQTGETGSGAPTYTHRTRLNCPHCPRTFTYRMGVLRHMLLRENLR